MKFNLVKNNIINKDKNFIDLGAWIGDNSLPWAKLLKKLNGNGIIYAIDPSEYNCNFIEKTANLNQLSTNIKTIQKAKSN